LFSLIISILFYNFGIDLKNKVTIQPKPFGVATLKYWNSECRANRRSKQEQIQACLDYALQEGGKHS